MAVKKLLAPVLVLALVMIACGVTVDLGTSPAGTPTHQLTSLDQVSTMVAQTLQAFTQEALSATPANTPTPNVTATPINTSLPPTLSVSLATDCYAGPSTHYGFVITIHPGTVVTVVGKDVADNYWIIDVPGYPGTVCWLSGQYASVSGDTSILSAPATPQASHYTLSEPTHVNVSCHWPSAPGPGTPWSGHGSGGGSATISWRNTEPNAAGVRVYRNGYVIARLGAGATSFTDDRFGGWGWHHDGPTYGVQAYNGTEVSSIVTGDCR
jgi:hypothetical protein